MKKSKLFDIIIYRILFSIPVSCVANFVYGFILFWALAGWTKAIWVSFRGIKYIIFVVMVSSAAIIPFVVFNMVRYLAIKSGQLRYEIKGLIFSSIPEYLFFMFWMLIEYIDDILSYIA